MNIHDQLDVLVAEPIEFVVIGGQASVLRQAIEFSLLLPDTGYHVRHVSRR